jgi:hypothetical protein
MAMIGRFTKQPSEVLDYDIDAGDWLPEDDFIVSASTTGAAGITIDSTSILAGTDGRVVKVWLSGGTSGVTYKLETTVTTDDGRVKQSEWTVQVKEI